MNENDAEKIAGAIHVVRSDWPTASLVTLIRKNLMHRPRRDVFVALSWIASEADTKTPARVLEYGPWWKAAGVEGTTDHRTLPPDQQCAECGSAKSVCDRRRADDPTWCIGFRPVSQGRPAGAPLDAVAEARAAARTAINTTTGPVMEHDTSSDDERCANDHCDRGAGHTGPHDARPVEVAEPMDDDDPEARPAVAELGSGCAA